MGTTSEKLNYLQETKEQIKVAIAAKSVEMSEERCFGEYADLISGISRAKTVKTNINIFRNVKSFSLSRLTFFCE